MASATLPVRLFFVVLPLCANFVLLKSKGLRSLLFTLFRNEAKGYALSSLMNQ
jgi:hypothetical protein